MKAIKEIVHPVKKEFRREKCGFEHTPPDDFVKSQWQNRTKSILYLIYRSFLAAFFIAVVIDSMIDHYQYASFGLYFIYMTNWGILLCMITNVYALILVLIWHYRPEYADKLLNLESLTSPFRIYWAIHITTLVVSIVITIIYWSLLYDANESNLTATNILTHALNSILMFVDLLIVAHPLRLLHVFLPVVFGIIYAIFSAIYQLCGGKNIKGKPYIYHVIDWDTPVNATLTVIGCLLLSCVVYMALFTIYKLRTLLYRRVNKASFILPVTTPPPPITKKKAGTGIRHSAPGISMVLGKTNLAFSKSSEDVNQP
ncbi:protein rolling stone [Haematobia irritans]|uniref:protein rolling stone n=1 Tax=Haematobia irritans TaxID=7368 RepID=UPI003F50B241